MDQAIADRIIALAMKWQNEVQWSLAYKAAESFEENRQRSTEDFATAKKMRDEGLQGEMLESFQHGSERSGELSEQDHQYVIAATQELLDLQSLLREHAPMLLKLMPRFDFFFDPRPLDLETKLQRVCEIESALRSQLASPPSSDQYVTLDQMAALVNMSKRTLESRKSRKENPLPFPDVDGGGGKADEWLYEKIRPWLEADFKKVLRERLPDNLRRDDRV